MVFTVGKMAMMDYLLSLIVIMQEIWKSTSDYVFLLSSGVVTWSSKKQPIVTFSTTEAEFITTAVCACQAI